MLENLKKLREEAGVSQKALADAVGVSQQSINKYENHNIEPDIRTLILIADYFDTSVDYLIGHTAVRGRPEALIPQELSGEEAKLLAGYRKLNDRQRESVGLIIRNYTQF